jgi:2-polyprenyl-3-methyl-5-hydroxy-6-metoxy-1,4-benzoquinol methylase
MTSYGDCPVCNAAGLAVVFERRGVPVNQNIVFSSEHDASTIAMRDIALVHCPACDFVFNAAFDEAAVAYDERYDNAQLTSPTYAEYIAELVTYMLDDCSLRDARIIEVGCGKGEFLRQLVGHSGSRVTGYGFDPSYAGPRETLDGRLVIEQMMFGPGVKHLTADALLCRHVIEHIGDPRTFLRTIVSAVEDMPGVRFFFETPSIEWILDQSAFWDIFYEHCNYWSARSMRALFESAGLAVDNVRTIWRDQFLWIEGHTGDRSPSKNPSERSSLRERMIAFAADESARRERLRGEIAEMPGRVALWGAAAKGVTMANLVDPERKLIAALVDINPNKQGRFIAGSGHRIVPPAEITALELERIYVMNPNYLPECSVMLKEIGSSAELVAV